MSENSASRNRNKKVFRYTSRNVVAIKKKSEQKSVIKEM